MTPIKGRGRLRTEKVSDQIARAILADIVARDLQPETMLRSEAQMVEDFQVSRGSLREALRILEVQGLIRVRQGPGGGPMVATVESGDFGRMATFYFHAKRADFGHLLDARLALEPIMARMAAERADQGLQERMLQNLVDSEAALDDTGIAWSQHVAAFHGLISGATGNPVLDLIGSSLNDIHALRSRTVYPAGRRSVVLDVHRKIAEAIVEGDGESAEHLSRRHMEELIKRMSKLDPGLMSETISWE